MGTGAEARLQEFEALRIATPPHHAAATYLGGYAVEALLKCAICQTLKLEELPVVFHVHDLGVLLFFSGLYEEIQTHAGVWESFMEIRARWSEQLRYREPTSVSALDCDRMDQWLNHPTKGVVPWLEARL